MFKFLGHRNFILPLAFILGFAFPQLAQWTKSLTIPALALVMTISIAQIPTREIIKWRSLAQPLAIGILFNYLFLASLLLIFTQWFNFSESIRIGMILVASAPPGVAVLPFTSLLAGNTVLSLFATFGTYLSSMFIMPGLIWLFTGSATFPMSKLVITLLELIVLPIILSRFLLFKISIKELFPGRGPLLIGAFLLFSLQ